MKVLQKKILILVIGSVLISAMVVMAIASLNFNHVIKTDSEQIMRLMCLEKAQIIDEKLLNIEQSVHTLYHFAVGQISEETDLWQDEEKFQEHISRMKALMLTSVKYTDGAVTVYYRLDPEIKGPKQGVWISRDENGEIAEREMTDISLYDKGNIERVGWYYLPIENGRETWLNPYYNQNMEEEIISYVIPIILKDDIIGVIGMDISTSLLYETAKSVKVYDTGYAFLMDDEGEFLYHPEMKGNSITSEFDTQHAMLYEVSLLSVSNGSVESYRWNETDKNLTAKRLRNGMIFTVCVEEREITQPQRQTLLHSVLVIMFIMSVFIVVTVSILRVIIRLVYTDSMTRVGNKTAYTDCVDTIYKKIVAKEDIKFAVWVADINNLKQVNDTFGHEYGDLLIQNGASILKKVWESKFVYRIGGDEFAIVYPNIEKAEAEKMILLFEESLEDYNCQNQSKELHLQMAMGMAVYDSETDKDYMDVFRRADEVMYKDKKHKKSMWNY